MPFKSKAQQRFMFARHPRIAKRWADEMKDKDQSIKKLPEKVRSKKSKREKLAQDHAGSSPANYWTGKDDTQRLEGGVGGGGRRDVPLPKNGFGTLFGTGHPMSKSAFDNGFMDEIQRIANMPLAFVSRGTLRR